MTAMKNHIHVAGLLLSDSRCEVNVIVNGGNALGIAALRGHTKIVWLLLSHRDIDANQIDKRNRKTALHLASENGHLEIVRALLLSPQIFVNEVEFYGKSALQEASLGGYTRVVKLLLRCPKTMVSVSHYGGYDDIKEIFDLKRTLSQMRATCCLDINRVLLKTAMEGDFRAVRGLLQCPDSEINVVDERGRTPLYLATLRGHIAQ